MMATIDGQDDQEKKRKRSIVTDIHYIYLYLFNFCSKEHVLLMKKAKANLKKEVLTLFSCKNVNSI